MPIECFSNEGGRYIHVTCSLSQTCCDGKCCDKNFDYLFYTHWYFWVAVTVLLFLVLGAVLSGYCHNCRRPLRVPSTDSCHGLLESQPSLGHCAWAWSLVEDKSPSTFLGFQTEKAQVSPTSLVSEQRTALFGPPKSMPNQDNNNVQRYKCSRNV